MTMNKNQDHSKKVSSKSVTGKTALWRGIKGTCPRCGQGKLFTSYLQQTDHCDYCHEDIASLRADDGPAWLTILVTGHIVAPFIVFFALNETYPAWVMMSILITIIIALVFILLPKCKGLFIAALWLIKQKSER